ncbi:MAG TPA: hypothetical protein VF017_03175, partial [Thermoanaerobaculia bacterium]|nr:hypothetical protein [Thermoanaerobaculia bacterium]
MERKTLTVEPLGTKKRRGKSRAFSVASLGWLAAPGLWEAPGAEGVTVPVWLAYFGSEAETRAFTANVRAGRKVKEGGSTVLQLPKKVRYALTWQRVPGGRITTFYLPELFDLEPAVPIEEKVRFILAPSSAWLEREAATLPSEFRANSLEATEAALFTAYLDRRLGLPLVADLAFQLRLFRAALEEEWTAWPNGEWRRAFAASTPPPAGLERALAVSSTVEALEAFVTRITRDHFEEEIRHGETRVPADCRLLPDAPAPDPQLRLDLAVAS